MQGQVAQAATELVQKSQQDQATHQGPKNGPSNFDGVLANKAADPGYTGPSTFPGQDIRLQGTQQVGNTTEATKAQLHSYLQTAESNATNHAALIQPVTGKGEPSKLAQTMAGIISDMEKGQVKLDQLISYGLSGKELSNTDMLSLQASMYKYTQEMDLTGKVVEKATNGLKETLKTQV